jgi:hypothetical protein
VKEEKVRMKRASSIMMSILLLASILAVSLTTRNVETTGTVHIMATGSIDPPTAPIQLDYSTSSTPPPTEWNKTYGGAGNDRAYSVVQTTDGGYAIAGSTLSYGAGGADFWLVKTDAGGNEQWDKTYGGASDDVAYCIVKTVDGGYAIGGFTLSFGSGVYCFWLIKTDANGNRQWDKTYEGNCNYGCSLVQTCDGGFALAACDAEASDFWLAKTDASGNLEWSRTYGEGGKIDIAYSVVQAMDGGYAVAGYIVAAEGRDAWLVKTDASGNMQWNKTYGGGYNDGARSLIRTSDGGFALAGYTQSFSPNGPWLVRTDSSGNVQWNKTYGGGAGGPSCAYSVVQTTDGGYAMAAVEWVGQDDFWLIRTDASGDMQWNATYRGGNHATAHSIVQTADGGFALAGYKISSLTGYDFWLVKAESRYFFPIGTYVIPMDEKQGGLAPENVTVYGFIWAILNGDAAIGRVIEPLDIVLKTATWPQGTVYSGGVILVTAEYGGIIAENLLNFTIVTIDTLTESTVISLGQLLQIMKPTRILVIQGIWGHTELTLDRMKLPYTLVDQSQIENNATLIHDYDLVVDDCPGWWGLGGMGSVIAANFIAFARNGGEAMFTDIALNDLTYLFPDFVNVVDNLDWTGNVTIHNPPLTGFPAEFPSQYPSSFPQTAKIYTMGGGRIVDTILNATEVRVLMDTSDYGGENRTLAFYFPFGSGLIEGFAYHPQEETENVTGDPYSYVVGNMFYGNKFIHANQVHDVTATSVKPSKTIVGQGYSLSVNVTVVNQGDFTEALNVTLHADSGGSTGFREPITIVENSGNTLTDYQVLLTMDTASLISAGRMRSDCGDIRFMDSAGFEIPYWIESGINSGETRIWVKVPSIPSSENTTIYMYYGNPSLSSTSDGNATFCLFDDFDSLDTTKWTVSELGYGKVSVSDGELVLNATSRSWSSDVSIVSKSVWQGSYTIGARARRLAALGESHTGAIWRANEGGYWYGLEHWVYQDCYNTADHAALSISGDTGITSSGLTAVPISDLGVIGYVKRDYPRKDYYSVLDGAQQAGLLNEVANGSWTTVQNTNRIGISANNYNSYPLFDYRYDWIFISKYVNPEPTTQIGEEEAGQTEIASQTANLGSGASATITFAWNTSGFAKGNYSISAYAWPVPGETSTADNNFTGGWVVVSMVGDLTGGTPNVWDFVPDGKVAGVDISVVSRCFGSWPDAQPPMRWEPNCDINNNGQVDGSDVATVARHFGESSP